MVSFRSYADVLEDFSQPVDPALLAQLPTFSKGQQVGSVSYIHWYSLINVLNTYAPGWSWEIRTQFLPDRCVIEGRLTLRVQEGEFFMEATGVEMLDSNGFGDPVYSAEASALRRALAKFGYGLDLWRKDKGRSQVSRNESKSLPQPIKIPADLDQKKVTQKQLTFLCTLASERELGIETDLKEIVASFGYTSKKDILQKDLDAIIAAAKKAGKFLTLAQRKKLADWWRGEGIEDAVVKRVLEGTGFGSTANIPRDQINGVKSAILGAIVK